MSNVSYVYWFNELTKSSLKEAGGKGANLGEMTQAGLPVPPGFAVSAQAYFDFIKANNLETIIKEKTQDLNREDSKELQKASEEIKNALIQSEVPSDIRYEIVKAYNKLCTTSFIPSESDFKYVAVRSSATAEDLPEASFAGQQATFLNIKGTNEVVIAVKKCWASLFEARAIYYRKEQGFDDLSVGLSAIVQLMVESEKSGIMFTADPFDSDDSKIVIEAGFGLGEAIVSGSVTPDRYVIDKASMKVLSKDVAKQERMIAKQGSTTEWVEVPEEIQEIQKLKENEITELAKYGKQIEEHYQHPQDIEWAVENGKVYIVQSRNITTLKKHETQASNQKQTNTTSKTILKGLGASPGIASGRVKIIHSAKEIDLVEKGDVLVTEMTSPDYVPAMKRAAAIVTDSGGMTCHAAIVSRELGIPAIVGSKTATSILKDGEEITVDATHGVVYEGTIELENKNTNNTVTQVSSEPYIVTGTKVYVNLAEVDLAEKVAAKQVDGVGLLRAEFMIAGMGKHPNALAKEGREQEFIDSLAENLRKVCQPFYPRQVVYRTNDFKSDEYRNLEGGEEFEPKEDNPMIGYRGCFRYVKDPTVFKMEMKAIKKVREEFGLKNLHVMIPFVRRTGELKHAIEIMNSEGLYRTRDFKLWIMVEVPSTVFILDSFIDVGIDGVSIGTNDLTQLILGVDRNSEIVAEDFDERHAAVIKAVESVIETCRRREITCSVCGQAPSVYPEFTEMLIKAGVTSVSVNPDVIEKTRKLIAMSEMKLLLNHARKD
ncbi:phosphoenolpyruvate synthase [Candidatus Micrarchaeota archaeon]|nr:phosphoenolpyruvate synthase [Candidatus Micrarchaeota archaeon]